MLTAARRALSQLFDPSLVGVLIVSVAGSAAIFAALWFGVGEFLAHTQLFAASWLDWAAKALLGVGTIVLTFFLFSAAALLIASLLLERVACAVERRWYPDLPPPRPQPMGEAVRLGIGFLGATIFWNLLALPLYVLLPVANVAIFALINGYLLGREYFELVAIRRLDRPAVTALRRRYRLRLWAAGLVIAALAFVPLANLVTPIFATAFMLHVFQFMSKNRQDLPGVALRC